VTAEEIAKIELELTAFVKDAMESGDWRRIVTHLMKKEEEKQRVEADIKKTADTIELEMEYAVEHAIATGDWDDIIYHLCQRRVPAKCVLKFVIKALRGGIPRPTHGIRTSEKEEENTYVAYLALYLARQHPEMKKGQIYDLTTETVNKDGINISRETVATYATKFKKRALAREAELLRFEDMFADLWGERLPSSRFRETMKPRRLWDWHRKWLK
jgi:hypothetical protein